MDFNQIYFNNSCNVFADSKPVHHHFVLSPQTTMPTDGNLKKGTKQRLSIRSRTHEVEMRTPRMAEDESILPPDMRSRLWKLFRQIEGELEGMYEENLACEALLCKRNLNE